MNEFVFFAAAYGLAASLGVLGVGSPFRAAMNRVDKVLFPKRWHESIPEDERGGKVRELVHCPACLSFWIALGLSFWLIPFTGFCPRDIATRAVWALAATGISWVVHVTLTKLGQYNL